MAGTGEDCMSWVKSCDDHPRYQAGCRGCQRKAQAEFAKRQLRALHGLPSPLIDATGTRRRIQALNAIGWDNGRIMKRLGMDPYGSRTLFRGARVHQNTAAKVARVYDELSMTPGPSVRARLHAQRRGYAPPLAWDDDTIDDPNAVPDLGAPDDDTAWADDVAELIDAGCSWDEIAKRLGLKPDSLDSKCRRHGRTDLLERIRRAAA